ncbi:MAG TPA: PKD domain-containing protein, partial [Thermoplasmata archaeon]|nr:PKD domain-containing protein [Thermoplasmata archaeon]
RYHWSVPDGLGCPLVDAPSIVCWPTARGSSYVAWVTVSDANGVSTEVVTSAQLSVFEPPSVTTPTATRPSADAGQTVRFATKVGGGSGGLDYTWSGLPGACSATNGSSPLCVVSGAALYRVSITVADSNGAVTSAGNDLPFRVFDAPSAGPAEEPRSAVDVGQSLGFSISASGGTGNFSYFWSGIPSNCSDRRGSAVTCTPTTPGNWTPVVLVRDSNGWLDFVRLSVPLVVYDDPQVALTSPGLGVADLGQTLRLSALPSGGLGPFSYRWEGLPDGCVATSTATPSCRPSAVGSFGVVVVVTDADGFTAQSPSLAVVIDPAPTAAALSTTLVPLAGAEVGFLASGSGGGGAFDYNWEFGDGARASGASATHAFRHPGTYRVTVTATDGNGANATANLTLQVQATGSEGLFGTAMPPALGAGIALAGLLALGIILWTVRRGTRRVARTRPVRPREPRAVAPTRDAGPASDLP